MHNSKKLLDRQSNSWQCFSAYLTFSQHQSLLPIPQKHSNIMLILVWAGLFFLYAKLNATFKGVTPCQSLESEVLQRKLLVKSPRNEACSCWYCYRRCRSHCHRAWTYIGLEFLFKNCNHDCSVKSEQRAAQKCLPTVNQHLTKTGLKQQYSHMHAHVSLLIISSMS